MDRHIRKLHLKCTDPSSGQHGRVLLEDAMRTATFGDEGQLVIVRRLDLGKLPPHTSATKWSRRVEETFRRESPVPIRFGGPSAHRANAVVFASRHEPWLILAERAVASQPCLEWFWHTAVPGWCDDYGVEDTLRLCFRKLAAQSGVGLTLALAGRVHAQGGLLTLLRSLQEEDFEAIHEELEQIAPALPVSASSDSPEDARAPTTPARASWLSLMQRAWGSCPNQSDGPEAPPPLIEQVTVGWIKPRDQARNARPRRRRGDAEAASRNQSDLRPFRFATWLPERVFTVAGGIFFVIPLLVRAKFPQYLESLTPEERTVAPWHVLRFILRHSHIPENDPLFTAFQTLPPVKLSLGHWLIATNRSSRQLTGLTLRQLVTRPGLVALTPTHLDVFFRAADADIRIRRAGLDLDPGWIPWLGRAVAYHFNREEWI